MPAAGPLGSFIGSPGEHLERRFGVKITPSRTARSCGAYRIGRRTGCVGALVPRCPRSFSACRSRLLGSESRCLLREPRSCRAGSDLFYVQLSEPDANLNELLVAYLDVHKRALLPTRQGVGSSTIAFALSMGGTRQVRSRIAGARRAAISWLPRGGPCGPSSASRCDCRRARR
jgi:hypothetical protein